MTTDNPLRLTYGTCLGCGQHRQITTNAERLCLECRDATQAERIKDRNCTCGGNNICLHCVLADLEKERVGTVAERPGR
jgi:hypothetical protein